MPATLSAISNGARHGILLKGGVHLENLSHVRAIAFDKTGTLTKGKPEVTEVLLLKDGFNKDDVLLKAASIESHSNHPLATAIVKYAKGNLTKELFILKVLRTCRLGCESVYWRNGKLAKRILLGRISLRNFADGSSKRLASEGKTLVFVEIKDKIIAIDCP